MGKRRIIIIGGVAAGASAAARLRRLSEDVKIILFERGPHVSFANCGLPYHVGGEIPRKEELLLMTPQSLKDRFNLDVRVRHEAMAIDRARKVIQFRNLDTGETGEEAYDELVLATGAAPVRPPIPGLQRPGHFEVRNVPDVEAITDWLNTREVKTAVVVGGGYVGLEMVEQLHRRGLQVTLVEALPQVMTPLDPEMAAWLHLELRQKGVELLLGCPVVGFEPAGTGENAQASMVVLKDGKRIAADSVILGMGVKPECGLAREAGLEMGELGGIRVDAGLRTSDPHIWAVGDVIEVRHAITGQWSLIPLAGPANRQGRAVANNIMGRTARYESTLGTAVLRLFSLTAASTGANEKMLKAAGIDCQALHLHPPSHAAYYPGASPVAMKVLFEPETGRLLGAQAVGQDGVEKRIDVIATALMAGMEVQDLADLELCYAPPFGSAKDPVNLAGMAAQNVMNGDVQLAQWDECNVDGQPFLLDVRTAGECSAGCIPGSLNIPLHELRRRLDELPRDREIVVHCQSGQRSYFACRFLTQNGFKTRNLTGSYRTWKTACTGQG